MTPLTTEEPKSLNPLPAIIPPLQNGDRMTRIEFERRYMAMPGVEKIQLIEGVVHMPSPVSHVYHCNPHFNLNGWLYLYARRTPGTEGGDNGTLKLDLDNAPQPDGFLIRHPRAGGQVRIDSDGYIIGAPELVAEVAASSASIDLNEKLKAYQRNGISEYIVWRIYDGVIDWFVLRDGRFKPLKLDGGLFKSEIFPGLWLDPAALISADHDAIDLASQNGISSTEHAAFVAELRQAASSRIP